MNEQEIIALFTNMIMSRDAIKLTGLKKTAVANQRKTPPTLGTMLALLYKAGKITITANEPEGRTKQDKAGNTGGEIYHSSAPGRE